MSSAPIPAKPEEDLLAAAVARWEADVRAYEAEVDALKAKIEFTQKRISLGRQLAATFDDESEAEVSPVLLREGDGEADDPSFPPKPKTRKPREGTWVAAVRQWVYSVPVGMTAADLRYRISSDVVFAAKFAQSEKGYYHALSRLQKSGTIVRHKGRYYSPRAFEDHQQRVALGEVDDAPAPTFGYSPMGEAILDIVTSNPGVTGPAIIAQLRRDPEFQVALAPHSTVAYNIMSRLVRRKQIIREDGFCRPGPEMAPRDRSSKWFAKLGHMNGELIEKKGALL